MPRRELTVKRPKRCNAGDLHSEVPIPGRWTTERNELWKFALEHGFEGFLDPSEEIPPAEDLTPDRLAKLRQEADAELQLEEEGRRRFQRQQQLLQGQRRRRLIARAGLTDRQAQVVRLVVKGKTAGQIAGQLNITVSAVSMLLHRAYRAIVRSRLKGLEVFWVCYRCSMPVAVGTRKCPACGFGTFLEPQRQRKAKRLRVALEC